MAEDCVPRGVFPNRRGGYDTYQPFGMLDIARNDPDSSWSYFGAPYNYAIEEERGAPIDLEPGYERGYWELMEQQNRPGYTPRANGGELGIWLANGQYGALGN